MTTKTALMVLGMHRSGTSSVAGALVLAGGAPPRRLMPAATDNPKGFWESTAIADFNDRLLDQQSSSWHDWRALDSVEISNRPDRIIEGAKLLQEEFDDASTIVVKDPRICRVFPFWRNLLGTAGYDVIVVSPIRPPWEVAASLASRNNMSLPSAFRLWMRHVLDAERASRGLQRHFILWPQFLNDWRSQLAPLTRSSSLKLDLSEANAALIATHLTTELHRQSEITPAPAAAMRTYRLLIQNAQHGEHPDTQRALDDIRLAFNEACEFIEPPAR